MDHYAKSASFSAASACVGFLLDQVAFALLMKEVEKKMKPHGMEFFLRDMATVVEYYLNNGDQRSDDKYIVPEDEYEPAPSLLDSYLPQSFKVNRQAAFGMLYSPEKRLEDELSRTGRGVANKIAVGMLRRVKESDGAEGAASGNGSKYDQVELPRVEVKPTQEQIEVDEKVQQEKVKYQWRILEAQKEREAIENAKNPKPQKKKELKPNSPLQDADVILTNP
jgi:hypothetical protein